MSARQGSYQDVSQNHHRVIFVCFILLCCETKMKGNLMQCEYYSEYELQLSEQDFCGQYRHQHLGV